LAQGLVIVTDSSVQEACLDPYWTLVQYFSSLKELGRAATLVASDIPEYLPSMQRRYQLSGDDRRGIWRSEELTGRKNETEIAQILRKLEVRYRREPDSGEQALDTLLATNMISVGVDVERLGLMMVVTQPKSTSEYIQASSRVGRSASAPGLVLTAYNASRSRDRSHYEQFRGYHESFYRFVEPTSVTPFSIPALERALHAGLVILARHAGGIVRPRDFDPKAQYFRDAVEFLKQRVAAIDPDHLDAFEEILEERIRELSTWNKNEWGDFGESETPPMMYPAGSPRTDIQVEKTWPVPSSMRNVDVECVAKPTTIEGEY